MTVLTRRRHEGRGAGRNVRNLRCTPGDVFDVLSDGWLYPAWVVGASRMRGVDHHWPAGGSRLHHSFGAWPALLDDVTVSLEWDPPRRAQFRAHGWPVGEAEVTIDVREQSTGCLVRISERPVSGPATFLPGWLTSALLRWRNAETLHRLAYLAENRAGARRTTDRSRLDTPMSTDMTRDEKRHDQLTSAPDATESDAAARIEVSERDGVTRVDIAEDAEVRPGPGPGMPEAHDEHDS